MNAKAAKLSAEHMERLVRKRIQARESLQLPEAVSLFNRLLSPEKHPPSILTINSLLTLISKTKHSSRYSTVVDLFNRFKCTRDRGISPTIQTVGEALHLAEKMMKQGLRPDDIIFRILLKASSNCENPDEVKKTISEMGDGKKNKLKKSNS